MAKLIGTLLCRNEKDRYLEQVIRQMASVCTHLVVFDDNSTDGTPELIEDIAREYGVPLAMSRGTQCMWTTNELLRRKQVWDMATSICEDGDWILSLDADETITNIEDLPRLIEFAEDMPDVVAIGTPLYDMWTPTHYRDDELWCGHKRDWFMCVRYLKDKQYTWRGTPLHCHRIPIDAHLGGRVIKTPSMVVRHWGWAKPEDREVKYKRYMECDPKGEYGNLAQYLSILDDNPNLKEFVI